MNKLIIIVFLLMTSHFTNAQLVNKEAFILGETVEIKSKILEENRILNVYLPQSYNPDSLQAYPVIYLLDGSKDEDFIHIAGLVQFCSFSWIQIIPETIVVGIANVDRKRDFAYPSEEEIDQKEFPTSGHSAKFIEYLDKEVKPFISKNYKINDQSTLIGQSLGGLLATQILMEKPDLFQNFIIVSPSLWWDAERLLKRELSTSLKNKSIYVASGNEGPNMIRTSQTLFHKLSIQKGLEAKLFYNYFEDKNHGDVLHVAVYDAFEKMFKAQAKKE